MSEHEYARPERAPVDEGERPRPADTMPWGPAALLALQQSIGNARVSRAVGGRGLRRQGTPAPATPVPATGTPTPAPMPAGDLAGAQTFVDHGVYGPQDVTPGQGNTGGFEAKYDPRAGQLDVTMRVAVNFKDSVTLSGGRAVATDTSQAGLVTLATRLNRLPRARRAALIGRYQWSPTEFQPWRDKLTGLISSKWGGQFEFHVRRQDWEWIGAHVNVNIVAHDGARQGGDHLEVTNYKFPTGENLYTFGDFSVTGPGGSSATDQTMTLASTDLDPRPDVNFLRTSIFFATGSATLDATGKQTISDWAKTFQGAPTAAGSRKLTATLEAHASSIGTAEGNQQLSQQRADAVRAELGNVKDSTGSPAFTDIATRISDDAQGAAGAAPGNVASDRRVDITVGAGDRQVLAVHEFGHAFGLDDEYANTPLVSSPSGHAVGDRVSHDTATTAMEDDSGQHLGGAVAENTDNIMSVGNVVHEQHYSMFHSALATITGVAEWALGPPHAKPSGSTPTPAPVPGVTPPPGPPPPAPGP